MSLYVDGQCWIYECVNPKLDFPDVFCKRCKSLGALEGHQTPKAVLEDIEKNKVYDFNNIVPSAYTWMD
jgi:hypothetical protein